MTHSAHLFHINMVNIELLYLKIGALVPKAFLLRLPPQIF